MKKTRVAVVFTGGTIAMKYDSKTDGLVPAVSGGELCEAIPSLEEVADIETVEFSNIPSPHMTPQIMLDLSKRVKELLDREDISGVVITHGTDTLEETAYFLDLLLETNKPVIVTGAMKSAGDLSPDGPVNLLSSVRVSSSDNARDKGVMVVMNEEVHSASEVTKTHTASIDTFKSPVWGPLGRVQEDKVYFKRKPLKEENTTNKKIINDDIKVDFDDIKLKEVELLKMYAGCNGKIIDYILEDNNIKGLVIEALGKGNIPPDASSKIGKVIEKGVPVVLTSRVEGGNVSPEYSYEGGGKCLKDMGVIFSKETSGQKAKLKLMLLLGTKKSNAEIKEAYEI
ncbi:asparaginase [Natranaerofaba carboxydovora]|uniref:asparaginase n=1 Tax=Natranaerofaba carboxydovora TaxID=2742683 RepID=UPI001F13E2CF|nr:asparaginase [Natranaerofaba carboxydovora]UMZ72953.1 putative L-asparaginase [Natranaerofaba carboxydovora]